jgi:Bifunctional DNA primase/polymerase, N-terminal
MVRLSVPHYSRWAAAKMVNRSVFPLSNPVNGSCSSGKPRCKNIGQHPRLAHGLKDATTNGAPDSAVVDTLARCEHRHATGAVSGFVVVDVDPPHSGDLTLHDLTAQPQKFPQTSGTLTGTGRYDFFQHPGRSIRHDVGKRLAAGLDLR